MKIERNFIWSKDKDREDYYGWLPEGMPMFNAGSPHHVAHDTIEHADPKDDSLEAEMRAFGAILYTRGEHGFWEQFRGAGSSAVNMAEDMIGFLGKDPRELASPGPQEPLSEKSESIMRDMLDSAMPIYHSIAKYNKFTVPYKAVRAKMETAMDWMRIGYRQQAERFADVPKEEMMPLFMTLQNLLQPAAGMKPGDVLKMEVDTSEHSISAKISRDGKPAPIHRVSPFQAMLAEVFGQ